MRIRERERERGNEKRKNVRGEEFMCSKDGSGGPVRERHSTCWHMESLAHYPQTIENNIAL